MVLCKIVTHSLICEAKYICSARAHALHVFLPFWMFNAMLSYLFFKCKGHLLEKDLEITERGRGTGNLQNCFRAYIQKTEQQSVCKN